MTYLFHIWIFYLILTLMADWQLHYMINVMTLTLQSSTFLFYVVMYHYHLLMVCMTLSWFDTQGHAMRTLKRGQLLTKKLMLQGYNESRLKSSFRKFYGRFIMILFVITNYHLVICWLICFIAFVRLSFSYSIYPVYYVSTTVSRRVWPVSRGCLLLHDTWSVLPYTRFCRYVLGLLLQLRHCLLRQFLCIIYFK